MVGVMDRVWIIWNFHFNTFFPCNSQYIGYSGRDRTKCGYRMENPIWTVLEIAKGLVSGFSGLFFAVGVLIVFGLGLFSYAKLKPVLLGLLIIPPMIGALSFFIVGHHIWPRFFFFTLGFGAIVAIRGVMYLGEIIASFIARLEIRGKFVEFLLAKHRLGAAFCLGLIAVSITSIPKVYGPKQDYEGAYNFITENILPGDEVATVSLTTFVYSEFYKTNWQIINNLNDLDNIRTQSKRTWLVTTFSPVMESTVPGITEYIKSNFKLIKHMNATVEEGNISIYRSDNVNSITQESTFESEFLSRN